MTGPRKSIVPADVLRLRKQMRGCDVYVLLLLGTNADREGWCHRRQKAMAAELRMDRVTVWRSLKRLVALGIVEKFHTRRDDGGDGASKYRLTALAAQLDLFGADPHVAQTQRPPVANRRNTGVAVRRNTNERPSFNESSFQEDGRPRQTKLRLMQIIDGKRGDQNGERPLTEAERMFLGFANLARRKNGAD